MKRFGCCIEKYFWKHSSLGGKKKTLCYWLLSEQWTEWSLFNASTKIETFWSIKVQKISWKTWFDYLNFEQYHIVSVFLAFVIFKRKIEMQPHFQMKYHLSHSTHKYVVVYIGYTQAWKCKLYWLQTITYTLAHTRTHTHTHPQTMLLLFAIDFVLSLHYRRE